MAPRPALPEDQKRTEVLENVRLRPDEMRLYQEAYVVARQMGEASTFSDFVRRALNKEARRLLKSVNRP